MKRKKILPQYQTILTIVVSIIFMMIFSEQTFGQAAYSVKNSTNHSYIYVDSNGKVGIDTSATLGTLTIGGNDGIIATGTNTLGASLNLGAGTRMMWYPKKAAFRAGTVSGTEWDDSNIGRYSVAMGLETKASGFYSTAFGYQSSATTYQSVAMGSNANATGSSAIALGYHPTASGMYSVALGYYTTAGGKYSTALGGNTDATQDYCTALGQNTTASNTNATATGYHSTASAIQSTAIGNYVTASGDYSVAIGSNVSTNGHKGSVIIGDAYYTPYDAGSATNCTLDNAIFMRFVGGYRFGTDFSMNGVQLLAGGSSWSSVSDSTKKYAFLPIDGEKVLEKINKFYLRTWSYKGQDSTKFRNYGPMAQEYFAAFGKDKYGVCGNDTTISTKEVESVNLVAIQTLIRRTNKLKKVQKMLEEKTEKLEELTNKINEQQKQIAELNKMKTDFTAFKNAMSSFLINKNNFSKTKVALINK
ncbi:MAG: hypothetical protein GXO87_14960 [Chlorobi bacterium]|nr:hypothetical protein [Chlorobiota bacterium]